MKSIVPPDVGQEVSEEIEENKEVKEEKRVESKGDFVGMNILLERINARVSMLDEAREVFNERINRMSEQIGEVRGIVVETEKGIRDIEVKATKASDLVREVHPEILAIETKKIDSKVEALNAKFEVEKSISANLIEEIKELKRQISLFRGSEAILKLNEDIKKELVNIQKVKSIVEIHSNKVEQTFIEVQKNFSDYQKLEAKTENFIALTSGIQKEVMNIKIRIETLISKKELDAIKKELNSSGIQINQNTKEIKKSRAMMTLLKMIEIKLVDGMKRNKKIITDFKKEIDNVHKHMDDIYNFLKKLSENINKKVPNYEIEELKKEVEKHARELSELLFLLEIIQNKLNKKVRKKNEKTRTKKKRNRRR